jgi:hypothetical protein
MWDRKLWLNLSTQTIVVSYGLENKNVIVIKKGRLGRLIVAILIGCDHSSTYPLEATQEGLIR